MEDSQDKPPATLSSTVATEKKELTKEQLLQYIKKLKGKVKEVEEELHTTKNAYHQLQADNALLEENIAAKKKAEDDMESRLIKAAEEIHQIKTDSASSIQAYSTRSSELEIALEEARRGQDDSIEVAERVKRVETELTRANEKVASLTKELEEVKARHDGHESEPGEGISQQQHEQELEKVKQENAEVGSKLKQLVERYKTLQTKAKAVMEENKEISRILEEEKAKNESHAVKLSALESENASLTEEIKRLRTKTSDQEDDSSSTREEYVDKLEKELKAVQASLEELRKTRETSEEDNEAQLNQFKKEKEILSKEKEELEKKISQLDEDKGNSKREIEGLEKSKQEQEESIKKLKTLLAKSRQLIQARDQELSKARLLGGETGAALKPPPAGYRITLRVEEEGNNKIWCRLVLPEEKLGYPSWIAEEVVKEWVREEGEGGEVVWPPKTLQEELRESLKHEEDKRKAVEEDFERYRVRAHAALKKAREKTGEEMQRDRKLEEENERLLEERSQLEKLVTNLEEGVKEAKAALRESKEAFEDKLEIETKKVWKDARQLVDKEKSQASKQLEEARSEVDGLRKQVSELRKQLEESEREGDELEEKISELESQLAVATLAAATATAQKQAVTGAALSSEKSATVFPAAAATTGKEADTVGTRSDATPATTQKINTEPGAKVPALTIPVPQSSSTQHLSSKPSSTSEDFTTTLGDQYVVIKQLTAEFQAERSRDLQLISKMQEEISGLNEQISRLEQQGRALKNSLRDAEDSLAREREIHAGSINVEYLKRTVYGYIVATTENEKTTLLSVIITMLHFTPEESSRARAVHQAGGLTGWINKRIGGGTATPHNTS